MAAVVLLDSPCQLACTATPQPCRDLQEEICSAKCEFVGGVDLFMLHASWPAAKMANLHICMLQFQLCAVLGVPNVERLCTAVRFMMLFSIV
jgi:hypothetical protein